MEDKKLNSNEKKEITAGIQSILNEYEKKIQGFKFKVEAIAEDDNFLKDTKWKVSFTYQAPEELLRLWFTRAKERQTRVVPTEKTVEALISNHREEGYFIVSYKYGITNPKHPNDFGYFHFAGNPFSNKLTNGQTDVVGRELSKKDVYVMIRRVLSEAQNNAGYKVKNYLK